MRYILGLGCDEEIREIVRPGIAFVMFEEGIIQECLHTDGEVEIE